MQLSVQGYFLPDWAQQNNDDEQAHKAAFIEDASFAPPTFSRMPVNGKTRTSSSHAPLKKPYKASATDKKPFPSKSARPTTSAASASSAKPATSGYKRKAEDDSSATASNLVQEKPAVASSILNAPEEIDFPRGGGTNLTQVEVREAQLEGEKEARDEEAVRSLPALPLYSTLELPS